MKNFQTIDESTALSESKEIVANLKAGLVDRVDPSKMTQRSGVPFRIFALKELLLHRMTSLAESAIALYESGHRVASYLLVRGCLETTGAIFNLHRKCRIYLEGEDVDALDAYLRKALAGRRDQKAKETAINAISLVDFIEKEYEGFRQMYDVLCEYAHPNYFGVLDAFGSFDSEETWLDLGKNNDKVPPAFGLGPLLMSLSIFGERYNEINDLGKKINDGFDASAA